MDSDIQSETTHSVAH